MATGTDDSVIPLADDFATGSREDWLNLVEKALRGRPAEPALVRSTYEGVSLNSLYHGNDRVAAHTVRPVIDEVAAANRIRHGWDIRQLHLHPDPETANADIRADLEGGAGSVALQLDRGARCLHGDRYYDDGLVVRRADDLDRVLAGVDLGRTAVALKTRRSRTAHCRAAACRGGAARCRQRQSFRHSRYRSDRCARC